MCFFASNKIKNTKTSLWDEEWGCMQTSSVVSDVFYVRGHLVGYVKTIYLVCIYFPVQNNSYKRLHHIQIKPHRSH